jgi:hypothetical protein
MTKEVISTRERVILLRSILSGAAQVVEHSERFEIIPFENRAGQVVKLWIECCKSSNINLQTQTVRAITIYLQNRQVLHKLNIDRQFGGSLHGSTLNLRVGDGFSIHSETRFSSTPALALHITQ